jgi:hypothetical protein
MESASTVQFMRDVSLKLNAPRRSAQIQKDWTGTEHARNVSLIPERRQLIMKVNLTESTVLQIPATIIKENTSELMAPVANASSIHGPLVMVKVASNLCVATLNKSLQKVDVLFVNTTPDLLMMAGAAFVQNVQIPEKSSLKSASASDALITMFQIKRIGRHASTQYAQKTMHSGPMVNAKCAKKGLSLHGTEENAQGKNL